MALLALQQKDPGQNHSQQDNDREGSKIFWHRSSLRWRGDGENNSTLRDNGGSSRYSDAALLRVPSTRSVDHVSAWPRASLTLFDLWRGKYGAEKRGRMAAR